jgi:hypothetical protein
MGHYPASPTIDAQAPRHDQRHRLSFAGQVRQTLHQVTAHRLVTKQDAQSAEPVYLRRAERAGNRAQDALPV